MAKATERLELVGVSEIARLLELSNQRAHQLANGDDFPRPVAELAQGRVWHRSEVLAWMKRVGR
jgi:prophage regulatory protein